MAFKKNIMVICPIFGDVKLHKNELRHFYGVNIKCRPILKLISKSFALVQSKFLMHLYNFLIHLM